jgi:succinate dehydrogenase/fumarate reductase cytochrome b subunit
MLDSERSRNPKIRSMTSMDFGFHGLLGLLILAGDIWAIINILQSSASNEKKILWVVVVALLPLIGLILWYFMGPRTGKP